MVIVRCPSSARASAGNRGISHRVPATSPPACRPGARPARRSQRTGIDAAACQRPCDHRIRFPHVAYPGFVSTPYRCRDGRQQLQDPCRHGTSMLTCRAVDGVAEIGSDGVGLAPQFVAEQAPTTGGAGHRLVPLQPLRATHRLHRAPSLLDRESTRREVHLGRGVIQVATWSPSLEGGSWTRSAKAPNGTRSMRHRDLGPWSRNQVGCKVVSTAHKGELSCDHHELRHSSWGVCC